MARISNEKPIKDQSLQVEAQTELVLAMDTLLKEGLLMVSNK